MYLICLRLTDYFQRVDIPTIGERTVNIIRKLLLYGHGWSPSPNTILLQSDETLEYLLSELETFLLDGDFIFMSDIGMPHASAYIGFPDDDEGFEQIFGDSVTHAKPTGS
jgi:hypothetical protein